ncbi:hypothetical protein DL237_05090 [Pseudooceanicola sediminis]|uniref:Anti-sigma factor n=1 Tax=Pseudooceanicola sediminis TaxID=2211117 RepID=A0A399J728_9RHOB|nr:hypothetical protein [Pseudooceanicola sediminis]KAA2311452.1 hypothetical protein E0K93_20460 [Puniceibacterium sp. HSS470]RII40059.1 hypothetical protein DL237_05090 [Pseudooceanicola sediminis]
MDDDKVALAGEFALGLLQGQDRQDALHALNIDPQMRAAVQAWEEDFATCFFGAATVDATPPGAAWSRIETTLFGARPVPIWRRALQVAVAPENRGLVIALALAKIGLLAWILYLFL